MRETTSTGNSSFHRPLQGRLKCVGFTLLELSVVLVIIGLLAGAILVGRDLIEAARVRAQIAQIMSFHTAVNTFRGKFGFLPGDLPGEEAAELGMETRSGREGEGDGDDHIDAYAGADSTKWFGGETALFWNDLATAGLIAGSYKNNTNMPVGFPVANSSRYLPRAKMGDHIAIAAADGFFAMFGNLYALDSGMFLFPGKYHAQGIDMSSILSGVPLAPGVTPAQAFAIDSRIDDGFPRSGHVVAGIMYTSSPILFSLEPHPFLSGCFIDSPDRSVYNTADTLRSHHPSCVMTFDFQ